MTFGQYPDVPLTAPESVLPRRARCSPLGGGPHGATEGSEDRAKLAQERLIAESPIPYSIVHATQFFEFVKNIADECLGDFALIELLRVGWHTAH